MPTRSHMPAQKNVPSVAGFSVYRVSDQQEILKGKIPQNLFSAETHFLREMV